MEGGNRSEDKRGRIQEEGYRREDSGRMVQGEDTGGRVQEGGDIERIRTEDTVGRRKVWRRERWGRTMRGKKRRK
jgi:hypothetical protein